MNTRAPRARLQRGFCEGAKSARHCIGVAAAAAFIVLVCATTSAAFSLSPSAAAVRRRHPLPPPAAVAAVASHAAARRQRRARVRLRSRSRSPTRRLSGGDGGDVACSRTMVAYCARALLKCLPIPVRRLSFRIAARFFCLVFFCNNSTTTTIRDLEAMRKARARVKSRLHAAQCHVCCREARARVAQNALQPLFFCARALLRALRRQPTRCEGGRRQTRYRRRRRRCRRRCRRCRRWHVACGARQKCGNRRRAREKTCKRRPNGAVGRFDTPRARANMRQISAATAAAAAVDARRPDNRRRRRRRIGARVSCSRKKNVNAARMRVSCCLQLLCREQTSIRAKNRRKQAKSSLRSFSSTRY